MAEDRPFAPTARRRALARAAGLTAASPVLVGAVVMLAAALFITAVGTALASDLGRWVHSAIESAGSLHATTPELASPGGASLATAFLGYALPVLGALALAAFIAHVAQTRALWMPRRPRLPHAPTADPMRGISALLAVGSPIVVALVTLGWLYAMAPRLAALGLVPSTGALLVVSFVAALATAWLALGTLDVLVRFAGHTAGLRMTRDQQRTDARIAGADPRWAQRRAELARNTPLRDAIVGASVLVLGDGVAAVVAWDPVHRPIPTRTAVGRDARATQLLALARHHALPVHRDPSLARLLVADVGPIPETQWATLAQLIAAVRGRR